LIIQDAFLHGTEGLYPEEAILFAVDMLLCTERGDNYSLTETAKWLRRAGYVKFRPIKMKKGTADWDGGLVEGGRQAGKSARSVLLRS
jgi:hypothetical protein